MKKTDRALLNQLRNQKKISNLTN